MTEKENCEVEIEGDEGQRSRRQQLEIKLWAESILRLAPCNREAWFELCDYLMHGVALDSDFVSKLLGVSQPTAHSMMLSFRSAGLVGVAKIPNYAYGEGYQYVYYSQNKTIYGGGVLGYLRKRIHEDLVGREVVILLSPKDVPSADMIVQNSYPLIFHAASSGSTRGLRLPSLRERIRRVTNEFTMREGLRVDCSAGLDSSRVIVVTLWRKAAEELNAKRQEGKLKGCLCVIPFAKNSVDTLADYALNHITLQTLLGEGGNEEEKEEEVAGRKEASDDVKEEETAQAEGKTKKGSDSGKIANESAGAGGSTIRERVLSLVRELGGVGPSIVVEKLGVSLPRVSEAVKGLAKKGLVKIARNIPDLRSRSRANTTLYLDAGRNTALHDAVMNEVWKRNTELGGKYRDYKFEFNGKTWHSDGLLENAVKVLLEVVTGEYDDRILKQIEAYTGQLDRDRGLRGVLVVVVDNRCLERLREKTLSRGIPVGTRVFIMNLRSKHEKLQFESLLRHSDPASYHKNPVGA